MTYCANCGIIIETYDCPVCGWKNFQPVKKNAPDATSRPAEMAHGDFRPRHSGLLVSGGVGAVLVALSAMLLGLIPILNLLMEGELFEFASEKMFYVQIIATITFVAGGAILAAGFLGLFVHYRASTGALAMVFIVVGIVMLGAFTFVALEHDVWTSSHYYDYYYTHDEYSLNPIIWVGHLFVGLMAILMGVSLVLVRRSTGLRELSGTAGALCIVSGALLIGLTGLVGVGWVFMSVACLVVAALFFLARVDVNNANCRHPHA